MEPLPSWTIYNGTFLPNFFDSEGSLDTSWQPPVEPTPVFSITSESLLAVAKSQKIVSRQVLICSPVRVQYVINNTYENSVQIIRSSFTPVQPYALGPLTPDLFLPFAHNTSQSLVQVSNLTNDIVEWYSNVNLINILNAVAVSLSGAYTAKSFKNWTVTDVKIPNPRYEDVL